MSDELGRKIIQAVGLEGKRVKSLSIHCKPGMATTMDLELVSSLLDERNVGGVFERYEVRLVDADVD